MYVMLYYKCNYVVLHTYFISKDYCGCAPYVKEAWLAWGDGHNMTSHFVEQLSNKRI